eukprot:CAMPEP_0113392132 /NCGR_PEP_ID=MMETSP0013_2-20120614/11111_1 /TAXON_ID=2843 ORGANISM="Skeletonema costatum, Strain 1716" /NCGR_SAMPLE_ID=MMETSP0013_2 /ASSEMBLY_ACC=CAM_ASM_000158 /LENGTH=273 /DNA_ID=CAMNT_0000275483 /DNA_START=72 /DNA_END=893 /DNA_ORIENTATION=- /assembly_acc=CAM_ASM_000158
MKLKLVPPFALLLAAVLFSAIPCACALSEAEVISSRKKTNPSSSHLLKIRHETVVNTMHVISENRGRRLRPDADAAVGVSTKSAKTTSKSAKASSSSCQAKLDTCQAVAAAPKWLFVQIADMCTLYRNEDGEYHIESSKFHKKTEWFTDRPFHLEATQPTSEWFKNFEELFDDEDGMPNAALTIVHDDTSKDVVVSVFAEGYIKDKEGGGGDEGLTYGYKLDQSTSQESVMSLEALMDGEDSVTLDHCSMFIDVVGGVSKGAVWHSSDQIPDR